MKKISSLVLVLVMVTLFSGANVFAATIGEKLEQPQDGWRRYEIFTNKVPDNRITFEGNWEGHYYTYNTTNYIKFNFIGTKLRLLRIVDDYSSKNLSVTIDGVNYVTNNNGNMPENIPVLLFEVNNLSNVEHTVVIDTTTADSNHHVAINQIDMDENGELKAYNESPIQIPQNLIAKASDHNIILNWDAVDGADSYNILRSTSSDAIDTMIESSEETTYIDNNVEPGVTYYYVVRAVKNGVESDNSNIASAMMENTNTAVLQIKLSTTDVYEYRITMNEVDNFIKWYIDRANGTGLPFYSFSDESKIEPYTDVNEYLIFDKIIWFKVKEYIK